MNVLAMSRVSTPGQAADDKKGFKRQHNDIDTFCDVYGLNPVKEFDLVVSGSDVQRSRGFREMLSMLKRKDIAGVVVPSLDRLLRLIGKLSVMAVFKIFEDSHKLLFCDLRGSHPSGGLDLNNPNDALMVSIKLQMAGMEKVLILHRTVSAREELQDDPNASVNKLPKGVKHDKPNEKVNSGNFRYDDFATGPVKEAFTRFLAGESLYQITRKIRYQGQPAFASVPRLRHVLKNEWWIGYKTRLYTIKRDEETSEWDEVKEKWTGGKRVPHSKPIRKETNLVKAPLISPVDFKRVQEKLKINHVRYEARAPRVNNFLGAGLLYCKCGAFMYHPPGSKGRADTYKCSARHTGKGCTEPIFKAKQVDDEIALQAQMILGGKDQAKFLDDAIRQSFSQEKQEEMRLAVQIANETVADLEKRIARVRRQCEESDDPGLGRRLKGLNGELASANEKALSAAGELRTIPDAEVQRFRRQLQHDFLTFGAQPMERKKEILKQYVERLTPHLNPVTDEVKVAFKIKVGLPAVDEDYTVGKPPKPPKDDGPVRVKHAAKPINIGGAKPLPTRVRSESSS
ncbi:MAG TPA: recombinase family protein [Bryobacteraceae bacterium]|nr:recombinase family protein [Bryobacteraceae bacterium]